LPTPEGWTEGRVDLDIGYLYLPDIYILPFTGKPEQQQFTI